MKWTKARKATQSALIKAAIARKKAAGAGTVSVPFHLAKLLAAERTDYKDPGQFEQVQATARAMLRLVMSLR